MRNHMRNFMKPLGCHWGLGFPMLSPAILIAWEGKVTLNDLSLPFFYRQSIICSPQISLSHIVLALDLIEALAIKVTQKCIRCDFPRARVRGPICNASCRVESYGWLRTLLKSRIRQVSQAIRSEKPK